MLRVLGSQHHENRLSTATRDGEIGLVGRLYGHRFKSETWKQIKVHLPKHFESLFKDIQGAKAAFQLGKVQQYVVAANVKD